MKEIIDLSQESIPAAAPEVIEILTSEAGSEIPVPPRSDTTYTPSSPPGIATDSWKSPVSHKRPAKVWSSSPIASSKYESIDDSSFTFSQPKKSVLDLENWLSDSGTEEEHNKERRFEDRKVLEQVEEENEVNINDNEIYSPNKSNENLIFQSNEGIVYRAYESDNEVYGAYEINERHVTEETYRASDERNENNDQINENNNENKNDNENNINDTTSNDKTNESSGNENKKKPRQKKPKKIDTLIDPISQYEYTPKDLKEANKITRKKEELLSEMVIQFSSAISECFPQELVADVFQHTRVETHSCDLPMIYWCRNIKAQYRPESDLFIPCPPKQVHERTFVLYYKAPDLISAIETSLQSQVSRCLRIAEAMDPRLSYSIIIVVEGYDQYIQKLKNAENRKYKDAVLKGLDETASQSKRRRTAEEITITAKEAEYLINKVQLELKINIFPVRSNKEVLEWLHSFTSTIAYSLYDKYERNQSLANLGTVRSGTDQKSTFLQTVRQFKMMTEPRADKLYASFQSIYSIYNQLKAHGTLGKDSFGKNIVPPTTDSAMKKTFLAYDPQDVINE